MAPTVNALRRRALETIAQSETAISADEVAVAINRSAFSVRPRVSELLRLGLIEPADSRGRNQSGMTCHLWRVTARGREALHD
jgi:hypothetical protein